MADQISRFLFPTTILYGPGSSGEIPRELAVLGAAKPLIVTDTAMEATDSFKSVLAALTNAGVPVTVFSGVQPNPHDTDVEQGAAVWKEEGCDAVIGIGGGSPMDAAKAIAVLVTHGGRVGEFDAQRTDARPITGPLPPLLMVPTTAGTGSEVGRCAVITSTELGRKIFLCSPAMMPQRAILDPVLTVSLPPRLTAATGMDALTHNIESLTAPIFHPMCDAVALKGIELAASYLARAVEHPADLEARGYMMLSAMMGAVAFQKDLGAAHSLSHALSAVCGLQHGLANAVVLPYVMDFNREVCTAEYTLVARAFGEPVHAMSPAESATAAVECIRKLNARIGIPVHLCDIGVSRGQLDEVVRKAYEDPCHRTNAKACTPDDLTALLLAAFE